MSTFVKLQRLPAFVTYISTFNNSSKIRVLESKIREITCSVEACLIPLLH